MGRCGHRLLQTRNDKEAFGLQYGQAGKTMVQCTSSWGSVPAGGYGPQGKLIVIEGTDGSGKATQSSLLCDELKRRGISLSKLGFPR